MTSFVDSHHSFEHSGLQRVQRAVLFLQEMMVDRRGGQGLFVGVRAGRRGLAAWGRRVEVTARDGWRAWVSSRKQAAEDERLWKAALKDARIMAELSRAMQGQINTP